MAGPIPGVAYYCDPTAGAWRAPGRPDLLFVTPPPPPPPPPPDPIPDPVPDPTPTALTAGAAAIGTVTYAIPTTGTVVYIAPTGNDTTGTGALGSPWKTAQKAINTAATGATIVVRAGTYHEALSMPAGKTLTLQAYPSEAVWFDGSSTYATWTTNTNGTWTAAYTVNFARFDVTNYPGASFRNYSDQVWVDGVALTQIADATVPGAGQFSVNQSTQKLTIGTNPVGHTVRVSDIDVFLVSSGRLNLKGIGWRRYSPQQVEFLNAAIYLGGTLGGTLIENCVGQESAMAALSIATKNVTVRNFTAQDCGYSGVLATTADGMVFERNILRRLNRGGWAAEPATAGVKATRTDSFVIRDNYVTDVPAAYGIWLDVSCTRFTISNNDVDGTGRQPMVVGIEAEESDGGFYNSTQFYSLIAGNRSRNNSSAGLKVLCTGKTRIWNNDLRGNPISLYMQQDRAQNNGVTGSANRSNLECPWYTVGNEIVNNILATNGGFNLQVIAYDDGPKTLTGGDMFTRLAGNWFGVVPSGGSMAQLGRIGGARDTFNTPAALAAAGSIVGGPFTTRVVNNFQSATAPANTLGDPLLGVVATAIYRTASEQLVGPDTTKLPIPAN